MIAASTRTHSSALTEHQCEPLLAALRLELQEYGALFNLLSEHQQCIISRESKRILELNEFIDKQLLSSNNARKEREKIIKALLDHLEMDEKTPLATVVSFFPAKIQSLLKAVIEEVVSSITKNQYLAQQNQILIKRAFEITEQILNKLNVCYTIKMYNRKGSVKKTTPCSEISSLNVSV